jgi:hypothetical protein
MILPRFTIRTAFAVVTACAVVFLIAGTAYRGQTWAWGVTIAVLSLLITALVHAAWFGVVWLFTQLPSGGQSQQTAASRLIRSLPLDTSSNSPRCDDAVPRQSSASS